MYKFILLALLVSCSMKLQTGVVTGKYKVKGKPHLAMKVGGKVVDLEVTQHEYESAKVGETTTVKSNK
jgi:hypothetical protein